MLLKNQGPNQSELILENGSHILFSYETPVAVSTVDGLFVTSQWYSSTTTKHINKWCEGISGVQKVPQENILAIALRQGDGEVNKIKASKHLADGTWCELN